MEEVLLNPDFPWLTDDALHMKVANLFPHILRLWEKDYPLYGVTVEDFVWLLTNGGPALRAIKVSLTDVHED